MLILLSPAKDMSFAPTAAATTAPRLAAHTRALDAVTRTLSRADLRRLMDISDALADLNHARFQAFDPDHGADGAPAILTFAGDVYQGLGARSLDEAALAWAQAHVRILSGLYGLLRPLDAIRPYRLEMGTRLATERGESLYAFWGDVIARAIMADLEGDTVINLASIEYFRAVDRAAVPARVVTPVFHEVKDGRGRIVSFFAKKARGMMARYAIDRRLEAANGLKDFSQAGYRYDPAASTADTWVFARPYPG